MTIRRQLIAVAAGGALSLAGVVVAHYEGYRPTAYLDPVEIPTICYGHTATARLGQTKTRAECDKLLAADLGIALAAIDRHTRVPLPDTRRAALASFAYNAGERAYRDSTLLRKLNQGDYRGACAELSRWVYAGGNKLSGLVKRRATERELCEVGL
jgi:lysozyme